MCNPAIAFAVISAATTAASVVSQVQTAKAQNAAISQAYQAQSKQIKDSQVADINDRLREARKEQGKIKVAAGEAGLQLGGSVATLLQDSTMQTALYDARVRTNAQNKQAAAVAQANSAYANVAEPTVLGAGLQIAQSGISGYSAGTNLQIQRAKLAGGS